MRILVIFAVLVLVGIGSAFGFKVFVEPFLAKNGKPALNLPFTAPSRDTSGFTVENGIVTPSATPAQASAPTFSVSTRFDKKAIFLTFENLGLVSSIDYTVLYLAKGVSKGVKGNIIRSQGEATILREILLGTCSGAICTYDEGVKTATVSATFTLNDSSTLKVEKTHTL